MFYGSLVISIDFRPFLALERSFRTISIVQEFPCGTFGQHSIGRKRGFQGFSELEIYNTGVSLLAFEMVDLLMKGLRKR